MNDSKLMLMDEERRLRPTASRDIVAIGFRHRQALVSSFVLILAITIAAALLWPATYESEMKILVRKERVDPLVTPGQPPGMMTREGVSEEDINSEIDLLRTDDLLRKVVLAAKLERTQRPPLRAWLLRSGATQEDLKVASAVRTLSANLDIEPSKKSNMIVVRYQERDPRRANEVLRALSKQYIEKHLELRESPGQLEFFATQTEAYRRKLEEAERKLAEFPRAGGTVAGTLERDITVQKLGDLRMMLQQTRASMQETRRRIAILEAQAPAAPKRITTQVRTADNPQLMQQLKGTLLTLELKRTELLQRFKPTYRAVQDVEQQIAEARSAIAAAEKSPMRDETTDRDPTYEWMRSELVKARTEFQGLQGRAAATAKILEEFESNARRLHESSIAQQDLQRTAKALEGSYEMYLRKQEEARIADALDRSKILNVQIAQEPTMPALPTRSLTIFMLGGFVLALMASLSCVFVCESFDQSFRTPEEVHRYLGTPVLAALPKADALALRANRSS